MQINKYVSLAFGLLILLTGCAAPPTPILPTTTPAPTVAEPTATATFLPPPTVTLFPTATARDESATIPVITATPGSPEPTSLTPATTATAGATSPQSSPAPQASPTPARSPTPTLSPTPIVSGLPDGVTLVDMIYAADFSQGWPTINEPAASLEIVNGQYVFEVGPFNAYFLTTTAVNRRDMYAQVEVTPEECPQHGGYGMIYRYQDAANYYLFTIFCDHTYTVIAKVAGSIVGVTNGALPAGADRKSVV